MADSKQTTKPAYLAAFRSILVATDFSESSRPALEAATAVAVRFRAPLQVVHVIHTIEESAYAYPFPMPYSVRDAAQSQLDEIATSVRVRVPDADGILLEGLTAREICEQAERSFVDLAVVGSHGRSGLPRFVHGSVAQRVVRFCRVPVLTVHPSDSLPVGADGAAEVRHIIAPTDLSEASRHGVDAAVNLALQFGAALTVVHAYELPGDARYATDDAVDGITAGVEQQARSQLDALLADVRLRLPKAEGVLRQGSAWTCVLDVATERGCDLVVMSTHGRHGIERVLVGSVADKILRMARVPVLTVHPI